MENLNKIFDINENKITSDISIEKIINEIFEDSDIIIPSEGMHRLNIAGKRYYYNADLDKLYPSVTTIISKYHPMNRWLLEWWCKLGYEEALKFMQEKALYGTFMHCIFKYILLGNIIKLTVEYIESMAIYFLTKGNYSIKDINIENWIYPAKQDIIGFITWIQEYKIKPIAIEIILCDNNYAGAIDFVGKGIFNDQEIYFICDFKTGRKIFYDDNPIQLEAYKKLWNYNYPQFKIDRIYNYGCNDYVIPPHANSNLYRFAEQTDNPVRKRWNHYLAMHIRENKEIKIKNLVNIRELELNKDSDLSDIFEITNPLEELKKYLNQGEF